MKAIKYLILSMVAIVGLGSCSSDFLNTEYTAALDEEQASQAAAANPDVFLNGIWSSMVAYEGGSAQAHERYSYLSWLMYLQTMGEDMSHENGQTEYYFDYQLDYGEEPYVRTRLIWQGFYALIDKANAIINLYPAGGSNAGVKGLVGQAYAIRGFAYDNLIQVYQDYLDESGNIRRDAPGIPLIYTAVDGKTQAEIEDYTGRNTVGEVIDQAGKDLEKAVELLGYGYVRPSKNYIDLNVANGLLARHYLYTQQWEKAAKAAKTARLGYPLMDQKTLLSGFNDISNTEWMWGFKHSAETQTSFASFFSWMDSSGDGYGGLWGAVTIDKRLYDQIWDSDYRKALFTGPEGDETLPIHAGAPYANLKFKAKDGWLSDYLYMRASEMVLIEAEAYAHLGDAAQAAQVLNELLKARNPQMSLNLASVEDVYLQRRIELWGEGFSYFDLKRLNKGIDRTYDGNNYPIAFQVKYAAHNDRWTFQIPLSEIQENSRIGEEDQNPWSNIE